MIEIRALLAAVAIIAAIFDYRVRRVPNWVTLSGIVLGVGLNLFLFQTAGLWTSLKGLGLAATLLAAASADGRKDHGTGRAARPPCTIVAARRHGSPTFSRPGTLTLRIACFTEPGTPSCI